MKSGNNNRWSKRNWACNCQKLLGEGANVVLVDWNQDVSDIAKNLGKNCIGIRCDVSCDTNVQETISKIMEILATLII